MKILITALLALTLVQGALAQNFQSYGQPQVVSFEQPVYQQPPRPSRFAKFLRVLGVALEYAAPIAADSRRATRAIQIASMAVAVTCEIKNCQDGSQSEYGQEVYYAVPQTKPPINANGTASYTVAGFPTTSFASGSDAVTSYQTASYSSSGNYVSPQPQYVTDSPETFQQDQPSAGLRSRVEWAKSRIRQVRGFIRGIRFRREGPWRWSCSISFQLPGGSVASCTIRADGTIEGLP